MTSTNQTNQKRVAILIENHFEDLEFIIPETALKQAGAKITVLGSRMNEKYSGKRGKIMRHPDATVSEMRACDFDAIVIPVGEIRANHFAVKLVSEAMGQDKIIATIGNGLQVLIETKQLSGRKVTGFHTIRTDLENAGAIYLKDSLVVDGNLITARRSGDLPIFTTKLLKCLGLEIKGTTLAIANLHGGNWDKAGVALAG